MKHDEIEKTGWTLAAILAAGEGKSVLLAAHIEQARKAGDLDVAAMDLANCAAAAIKRAYGDDWAAMIRQELTILEIERLDAEE